MTAGPSVITLLDNANLSTFIHEAGHFFLQVQADMAARIEARQREGETLSAGEQRILRDLNTTLAWFGIKDTPEQSALDQWHAMTPGQQREHHERNPRIDYYQAPEALIIIDSLRQPHVGGDVSSILNRIVGEWAEHCHRKSVSPEIRMDDGRPPDKAAGNAMPPR